jgi:transcriptional regulator with XRE-family HTH domain
MQKQNGNSKLTPKQALQAWVKANGITIKEFSEKMGYTYAYAWQLTSGSADITYETLGRMAVAYGCHEAERISRLMKIEA